MLTKCFLLQFSLNMNLCMKTEQVNINYKIHIQTFCYIFCLRLCSWGCAGWSLRPTKINSVCLSLVTLCLGVKIKDCFGSWMFEGFYDKMVWQLSKFTVMILNFRTERPGQTVQTQIRLLLEGQSDQGLHCLPL